MPENDSDDEHVVSSDEYTSESDAEGENDEEGASNAETKSDATEDEEIDLHASAEVLEKLIPFSLEDFEKVMSFVKSIVFLMMWIFDVSHNLNIVTLCSLYLNNLVQEKLYCNVHDIWDNELNWAVMIKTLTNNLSFFES